MERRAYRAQSGTGRGPRPWAVGGSWRPAWEFRQELPSKREFLAASLLLRFRVLPPLPLHDRGRGSDKLRGRAPSCSLATAHTQQTEAAGGRRTDFGSASRLSCRGALLLLIVGTTQEVGKNV